MVRITLVTTSARVAPGVLTASAWDLLRSVPVFCGSPGHPQRSALAEVGVPVEVVDVGADAVRLVGGNGHPASRGAPVVSETFVAAMRALADDVGVTEVAWLAEPAHMLPVPPGADPDAATRPEPASGVAEPPASGVAESATGQPDRSGQPGRSGRPDTAGEASASTSAGPASVDAEIRVLGGTRELPGSALLDAVAVMDRLRSPGGCPWDAEQTHASLAPYLIEETYEAYQAIEDGNLAELREELGDVLLQVLFHARVAAEGAGGSPAPGGAEPGSPAPGGDEEPGGAAPDGWDVDAVAADLVAKLVRRHPHVFGEVTVDSAEAVAANWDVIKNAEKARVSVTDGVPPSLPALSLANKLLARSARIGIPFDLAVGPAPNDAVDATGAADPGDLTDAGDAEAGVPGEFDVPGIVSALAHRIAHNANPGKAAQEETGKGEEGAGRGPNGGRPAPDLDSQMGSLLFAAVALAATAGVDPEAALRRAARTFRDRIIDLEQRTSNNV